MLAQVRTPERWSPLHSGRTHQNYYTPRPASGDCADYWAPKVDPDGKLRDRKNDEERERFLELVGQELAWVQSRTPEARVRVCDCGHGLGWLLSALPDSWEKHGVEVCREAHEYAKGHYGIKSFFGELWEARYPDEFFDVVTCWHVLEHVADPIELICEIRRVLKRGGLLLLGTPDFESPCAKRFGNNYRLLHDKTHVSLFGLDGLTRFIRDHGFEIEDLQFPFPERFATAETFTRWNDTTKVSPPWPGNFLSVRAFRPPK